MEEAVRAPGGATVWFTGLPAAGKTTVARALEVKLREQGRTVLWLDGDELRRGVCRDLGFSAEDRAENVRRAGEIACLVAGAGVVAVVSLVSPYAADRAAVRARHAEHGAQFTEVHVATPPEVCEQRDPKGLWARARAGELTSFTGVDDPYEAPEAPELAVGPWQTPEEAAAEVLARLG
ncbi:MAG TPA: adenylyl-sulfate kinase [Thermoleophilaceae bacterium]|nr:adenylyl-sulfate kinase [Thermoleophilaceae bacterium]